MPSHPLLAYLVAVLAFGVIATWASENLFWSSRSARPEVVATEFAVAFVAYAIVAAAALSLVIVSGVQGWRAAFLGGVLLGFGAEGVVVGEMYASFPWQIVWTPLAWHGLVTGLAVIGLARSASTRSPAHQALSWLLLGLGAGAWAQFWPGEVAVSAGGAAMTLLLPALLLPVANLALDRVGGLTREPWHWWLWVAPAVVVVTWVARLLGSGLAAPLFVWPVVVAAAYAVARHHGDSEAPVVWVGDPVPLSRHLLILIAPATAAAVAAIGWASGFGAWPGSLVYAVTSLGSLGLFVWLGVGRRDRRDEAVGVGLE